MNTNRLPRIASIVLVTGLMAALLAACGGSNKPASRGRGPGVSFSKFASDAYKHSACMRSHGVSSFPDPTVVHNSHQQIVGLRVTPAITGSPSFKSAQATCAHLMPAPQGNTVNGPSAAQVRAHTEGMLGFAACMRRHGFSRFPDPNSQGQLSLATIQKAGIDLLEPAVRPAANACTADSHGQITKANIAQALASGGASGTQSSAAQGSSGG
jgi:hypothetical protein